MKLTILGGHGTYPVAGGACSGYLLEQDGFKLWMDAGNGTFGKLQEHWAFEDIDAIWISHAHPDHSADLYPFFYRCLIEGRRMPVFAPSGVREKLAALIGEDSKGFWYDLFEWQPVDPGTEATIGPWSVRGSGAQHSSPNTVLRMVAAGTTFTYTGDTGPHDDLVGAARDADLFLCEASWVDPSQVFEPIHLLASEAGSIAAAANVQRLALTHIWACNDPDRVVEEAAAHYDGPISLATAISEVTI